MSTFKQFPGFSFMTLGEGSFRLSWDKYHERMSIEYIRHGIYVSMHLDLEEAEATAKEMARLVEHAKTPVPDYDPTLPQNAVKLDGDQSE